MGLIHTPSRGKGWVKSAAHKRLPGARSLFGARRGANPASADLTKYVDEVWDQEQASACVGFATSRAVMVRCAVMGTPIARPSRVAPYTWARAAERAGASVPLQDQGCEPADAVAGIAKWGICSDAVWPFDMATINDEPTLEDLEDSAIVLISGSYSIDTEGADRLNDVCQALAAGYPVTIGVQVDNAFEAYMGKGCVTAPIASQELGGHDLCLLGYETQADGSIWVRGVNSWTSGWGDHGYFWADMAWLTDAGAGDLQVLTCSAAR
jgi:hypothetical protein